MNKLIRRVHRWLGIVFTLTVIANIVMIAMGRSVDWITYSPLPPLLLMLLTGLWMFALPYFAKQNRA